MMRILARICMAAAVFCASEAGTAIAAPTESVIYQFTGKNGNQPGGTVVADAQGNLYGTTGSGGAAKSACPPVVITTPTGGREIILPGGCGIVFKLKPPAAGKKAWTESILADFSGSNGSFPDRTLIFDQAGNLYGVTSSGGGAATCPANLTKGILPGCGVIFKLSPPVGSGTVWTETVLHLFTGADGATPVGLIFGTDGNLYGVTSRGGNSAKTCPGDSRGAPAGCGVVYKLARPAAGKTAWTETVLHDFGTGSDGTYPVGDLALRAGNLYGVASAGSKTPAGCAGNSAKYIAPGCGAVFELAKPAAGKTAWTETLIYRFPGEPSGAVPYFGMIFDKAGNLYGTTSAGGTGAMNGSGTVGNGTVYRLSPPAAGGTGWTATFLRKFGGGTDGSQPYGSLVIDGDGNLYGTTAFGGGQNLGAVFELTPPASGTGLWKETLLHRFSFRTTAEGFIPLGTLLRTPKGVLYGTTDTGGILDPVTHGPKFNEGTVFEITP